MPTCACGAPIRRSKCKARICRIRRLRVGLILAKAQAAQGAWFPRGSKIDELQIDTGNVVVTGSKTAQVEVKE